MHLWNDYEGKTIAEHYPLTKLLRPEGRSAFFLTVATDHNTPATIRLTESLNDEHEMLDRWQQVAAVDQPNLVHIETCGQTIFDGVPLTYALMESTDSSLAEILLERPLTAAETKEVALAVTAALRALHGSSLIHEHVEPASVMASGDVIKLRSDCVRQCVPDGEFQPEEACVALRQKDVQDLGTLLLQCLTLDKALPTASRLPAPFDAIVPHALDGSWGLAEISDALTPPLIAPARPLVPEQVLAAAAPKAHVLQFPAAIHAPEPALPTRRAPALSRLPSAHPLVWAAGFAILLLVLLVAMRTGSPRPVSAVPHPVPVAATAPEPKPSSAISAVPATAAGWRVVAYTYNHQEQAWKKAGQLRDRNSRLNPEVFSPTGGAPWLLTLGGPTDREQAEAMLRMARRAGLPRDTFVRYYPGRG